MASKRRRSESAAPINMSRRLLRSSDPEKFDDGTKCCLCAKTIPFLGDHVELRPCGCTSCPACLLRAHATRGKSMLSCGSCGLQVESHVYHESREQKDVIGYNNGGVALTDKQKHDFYPYVCLVEEWQKEEDPAINITEGYYEKTVLYSCSIVKGVGKTRNQIFTRSVTQVISRDKKDGQYSPTMCDKLCAFAAALYPLITRPCIIPYKKVKMFSPRQYFDYAVAYFTPLMAMLFGLATGKSTRDLDKINSSGYQDYQSQYLAISTASDIILRCTQRYPGQLQLMLGNQIEMQKVSNVFRDIMSMFRIIPSRNYSDNRQCASVVESLTKGIDVGPYDIVLLNGDNIGFTIKGENASYSQWILFQDIIVRQSRLKQIKMYAESPSDERLSWVPAHDWMELCQDASTDIETFNDQDDLAKSLVDPTKEDYEILTHTVLEGIQLAKDLVLEGKVKAGCYIPRAGYIINQDTRKKLESGDIIHEAVENNMSTEGANPGETADIIQHGLDPDDLDDDVDDDVDTTSSTSAAKPANKFYGHDTTLNPVKADLSKKASTCMIAAYTLRVQKKIVKKWWKEVRPTTHNIEEIHNPPAALLGAWFMCDGQPAAQLSKIVSADNQKFYRGVDNDDVPDLFPAPPAQKEEDEDDEEFEEWYKNATREVGFLGKRKKGSNIDTQFSGKFMTFFGGFHAGMKTHNCRGMMFANIDGIFYAAWRDTYNKVKWILYPSDPTQLENELPQYILVHYRSAYEYLWESWGRPQDKIPSATDVHKYMLRRAENSPYRQAILVALRFAEVSKLIKNAAKLGERGSVDLFMTAIRFALTLWTTTHATEYVRLGCDLLVFMHCASDAVKAMYANEMFTRMTSTGKPEFADLHMKKSVGHVRKQCGKVNQKGMDKKMEIVCNNIPNRPTDDDVKSEIRTGYSKDHISKSKTQVWVKPNSPWIQGFDLIHHEMQVWHHTEEPIIEKASSGKDAVRAQPNSLELAGGETLNPDVLRCFSIGLARARQYMRKYYIDTPFRVNRSEKEVALTKILASSVDRKKELEKAIHRKTSVEEDELDKAMNMTEVGQEIKEVTNVLNFTHNVQPFVMPVAMNKLKKREAVMKLITLRKQHFKKDKDARDSLEANVRTDFHEKYPGFSTDSQLDDLLIDPFYCLSESVMKLDRYKSVESSN